MLKNLKFIYQQRGFKLKCLIGKKAILHKRLSATLPNKISLLESSFTFFNNISEQNCLDKPVFVNVNGLNHSSRINKTVRNKIKDLCQYP